MYGLWELSNTTGQYNNKKKSCNIHH